MSRQRSIVHLSGQFDDTQLSIDGKNGYAKLVTPISKDRIMTDDAFVQVRKSMAEFKAASLAVDMFSECLGEDWKSFGERFLRGRMQQVMRSIVRKGSGTKGQRRFEIAPNRLDLRLFELNKGDKFRQRFSPHLGVTVNPDRNTATLVVPAFRSKNACKVPPRSTHFRMSMTVGVLTDFVYDVVREAHFSSHPEFIGVLTTVDSGAQPLGNVPSIQLVGALPGLPVLPSDACLVVTFGVEFMEIVNGQEEIFEVGRVKQVFSVY